MDFGPIRSTTMRVNAAVVGATLLVACGRRNPPPILDAGRPMVVATQASAPPPAASSAPPPVRAKPVADVKVAQLVADYQVNEVRADSLYKGKIVRVTGIARAIKKDALGAMYIPLATDTSLLASLHDAHAGFDDVQQKELMDVDAGDVVTVDCEGNGLVMQSPVLAHCTFSDPAALACAKMVDAGLATVCRRRTLKKPGYDPITMQVIPLAACPDGGVASAAVYVYPTDALMAADLLQFKAMPSMNMATNSKTRTLVIAPLRYEGFDVGAALAATSAD